MANQHILGNTEIDDTNVTLLDLKNDVANLKTQVPQINEKASWWKTPVLQDLIYYGNAEFHKNEWILIDSRYAVHIVNMPVKPNCTRWFNMRALTNDNATNEIGMVCAIAFDSGNWLFYNFTHTWGSGGSDHGNWKISKEFYTYDNINKGWANIDIILPDSSNGSTGHLKQLWLDAYDVPNGINPNNSWF